ncbi:hypothetical protein ACQKOE_15760 [Novosphingobium sp. NPDC080210]|uniref:hypothetical protein n=1 Tax=Novosphingobium sp. NPDC080210 TaxID=3390596 RepID=UPI003CFF7933
MPYYGMPWQSLEDTAASNSQYYAQKLAKPISHLGISVLGLAGTRPRWLFERLEMRMTAIIARYEAILDGREPQDVLPAPTRMVIKGPWSRSDA